VNERMPNAFWKIQKLDKNLPNWGAVAGRWPTFISETPGIAAKGQRPTTDSRLLQ
jgi:hypothetical protein